MQYNVQQTQTDFSQVEFIDGQQALSPQYHDLYVQLICLNDDIARLQIEKNIVDEDVHNLELVCDRPEIQDALGRRYDRQISLENQISGLTRQAEALREQLLAME